jgi:hypothetical protein
VTNSVTRSPHSVCSHCRAPGVVGALNDTEEQRKVCLWLCLWTVMALDGCETDNRYLLVNLPTSAWTGHTGNELRDSVRYLSVMVTSF